VNAAAWGEGFLYGVLSAVTFRALQWALMRVLQGREGREGKHGQD
jgi:hypothetical protein